MNRPAFTLVELMLATAITCVIAAGVYVFFSGSGRISREGYREINAALSNRVDREKRLFVPSQKGWYVNPPVGETLNQETEE